MPRPASVRFALRRLYLLLAGADRGGRRRRLSFRDHARSHRPQGGCGAVAPWDARRTRQTGNRQRRAESRPGHGPGPCCAHDPERRFPAPSTPGRKRSRRSVWRARDHRTSDSPKRRSVLVIPSAAARRHYRPAMAPVTFCSRYAERDGAKALSSGGGAPREVRKGARHVPGTTDMGADSQDYRFAPCGAAKFFMNSSVRCFISSGVRSSLCVAIVHWYPCGSVNVPERSPQN